MGIEVLRLCVLKVAGEGYEVGMLRVDAVDNLAQQLLTVAAEGAYVGVAEMDYAVAVEGSGQVAEGELDVSDL